MKKIYHLIIILIAAVVMVLVVYQLTYSSISLFEDGMKGIARYRFKLGMSPKKADQHFSNYGKLTKTTETAGEYGKITWLTYESRDGYEILELQFTNNRLSGFCYVNWGIK